MARGFSAQFPATKLSFVSGWLGYDIHRVIRVDRVRANPGSDKIRAPGPLEFSRHRLISLSG